MTTSRRALVLVVLVLGALPSCFLIPRPHRFEDVDASHLVSVQDYAAWSDGAALVLDLTPYDTPYRGLWYLVEGGNLYLSAHYDSVFGVPNIPTIGDEMVRSDQFFRDGDRAVLRYRIDMAKLGFPDDWSSHVFWLVETPWFLIPGPAVFMESRREPAKRKSIVVGGPPPAIDFCSHDAVLAELKHGYFERIERTRDLPDGVLAEFERDLATDDRALTPAIAEPGDDFQSTDVVATPPLPMRRLIFGGRSEPVTFIYYERGGLGLSRHLFVVCSKGGQTSVFAYLGPPDAKSPRPLLATLEATCLVTPPREMLTDEDSEICR